MQPDWTELEAVVRAAEERGTVGVSLGGPHGVRWSHNGARAFRAASTVKIPLMLEVFRGVERGAWSLDDWQTVHAADKARGSGVLAQLHDGLDVTLADLLYLTISISDNTATNLLIQLVGMPAVNATMRALGMHGSNLSREMKGRPAVAGETENLATPDDYALVTQAILEQRAASESSCAAMVALLEQQQNARRIARYLPEDGELRWGSKTGSISGVTNDVGFVTGLRGTLIIAVFCDGFPDQHVGEQVIGDITRAALRATGVAELGGDPTGLPPTGHAVGEGLVEEGLAPSGAGGTVVRSRIDMHTSSTLHGLALGGASPSPTSPSPTACPVGGGPVGSSLATFAKSTVREGAPVSVQA